MKFIGLISVLCLAVCTSALPFHNGMMFYHLPYFYNPYEQPMFYRHTQPIGRTGSSAFAAGDNIAAGTIVKEQTTDAENPPDQARSVEAIAEAYPHESIPVQENGSYDPADDDHNQVIPLDVLNVNEPSPATVAPKKKVQIALEIPDDTVNNADNEAQQNNHQRKPKKPTDTQPQGSAMFFPMSFGESDGGATIAVANAFSDGPGAVRSHAIAYGMPGGEARRRAVARAASAAQRAIGY